QVRETPLDGRARTQAMLLFSIVMAAYSFNFGVGGVHLVRIIEAAGVTAAIAVALGAYKGVAQVIGRVWELVYGRKLAALNLGRVSIALLPLSFIPLLFAQGGLETAVIFATVYGISNGLMTIVRGAVPLALFGARDYGTVLGILATPALICNALAPVVFAWFVDAYGYRAGTWLLLGVGVAGWIAMEGLKVWHDRRRPAASTA
ncbi:MAG: hypothetical protein AAFO62_05245, partial [Pseudomonadota bacterium]